MYSFTGFGLELRICNLVVLLKMSLGPRWDLNRYEKGCRVQVIFTCFVYNANVLILGGAFIRKRDVDLPYLQRFWITQSCLANPLPLSTKLLKVHEYDPR